MDYFCDMTTDETLIFVEWVNIGTVLTLIMKIDKS